MIKKIKEQWNKEWTTWALIIVVAIVVFSFVPITICEEECVTGITQQECPNTTKVMYQVSLMKDSYSNNLGIYLGTLNLEFQCAQDTNPDSREKIKPIYSYYVLHDSDMNKCCYQAKAFGLLKYYNKW